MSRLESRWALIPALALLLGCSLPAAPATAETTPAPDSGASGTIRYPVEDLHFVVEGLVFGSASENGAVKEEGSKITVAGEVLFAPNASTLAKKADRELRRLVHDIQTKDAHEIRVVGHTDNVQGRDHNQKLSEQRARTIGTALRKALGGDIKIATAGKGQDHPVADNKTEEGRKLNRRVEVTVLK